MLQGVDLGPLQGIPYGLKDLISVKGYRTTWGAPAYTEQMLDTDAYVYKRCGPLLPCCPDLLLLHISIFRSHAWVKRRLGSPTLSSPISMHAAEGGSLEVSYSCLCRRIPTLKPIGVIASSIHSEMAVLVCRLQKAGAVLIAKLATGEMAFDDVWWGGKVKNPWNVNEGSSGSSAGPAAAVVAGAVAFAVRPFTIDDTVDVAPRPCLQMHAITETCNPPHIVQQSVYSSLAIAGTFCIIKLSCICSLALRRKAA